MNIDSPDYIIERTTTSLKMIFDNDTQCFTLIPKAKIQPMNKSGNNSEIKTARLKGRNTNLRNSKLLSHV